MKKLQVLTDRNWKPSASSTPAQVVSRKPMKPRTPLQNQTNFRESQTTPTLDSPRQVRLRGVHLKREQLCSAKRDLTQHHRINIVVVDESSPPCELVKFSTVSQMTPTTLKAEVATMTSFPESAFFLELVQPSNAGGPATDSFALVTTVAIAELVRFAASNGNKAIVRIRRKLQNQVVLPMSRIPVVRFSDETATEGNAVADERCTPQPASLNSDAIPKRQQPDSLVEAIRDANRELRCAVNDTAANNRAAKHTIATLQQKLHSARLEAKAVGEENRILRQTVGGAHLHTMDLSAFSCKRHDDHIRQHIAGSTMTTATATANMPLQSASRRICVWDGWDAVLRGGADRSPSRTSTPSSVVSSQRSRPTTPNPDNGGATVGGPRQRTRAAPLLPRHLTPVGEGSNGSDDDELESISWDQSVVFDMEVGDGDWRRAQELDDPSEASVMSLGEADVRGRRPATPPTAGAHGCSGARRSTVPEPTEAEPLHCTIHRRNTRRRTSPKQLPALPPTAALHARRGVHGATPPTRRNTPTTPPTVRRDGTDTTPSNTLYEVVTPTSTNDVPAPPTAAPQRPDLGCRAPADPPKASGPLPLALVAKRNVSVGNKKPRPAIAAHGTSSVPGSPLRRGHTRPAHDDQRWHGTDESMVDRTAIVPPTPSNLAWFHPRSPVSHPAIGFYYPCCEDVDMLKTMTKTRRQPAYLRLVRGCTHRDTAAE